jgi:ribosomal protein S18 acetylase RimI-like enzyme
MSFNIVEITDSNIFLLNDFILNNKFPESFRYFNKRSCTIIKNHLITVLLFVSNESVGYAHIDMADDKHWFGICILDNYQGKGYGKYLIKYILNNPKTQTINKIHLTVDKNNNVAIQLYLKYNFKFASETDSYYVMSLTNI